MTLRRSMALPALTKRGFGLGQGMSNGPLELREFGPKTLIAVTYIPSVSRSDVH